MVTAGEQTTNAPTPTSSNSSLPPPAPTLPAFRGGPRAGIEFTAHVKWVLPESPDYGTASSDSSRYESEQSWSKNKVNS